MVCTRSVFLAGVVATAFAHVGIVTFDGNPATTHKFEELNDPVMGGKSVGNWTVDTKGQFGVFQGEVVNVPSLSAPGFIKAAADDGKFVDVSQYVDGDLVLTLRTTNPEYEGYRVSFAAGTLAAAYACAGGGTLPLSRGCFKSKFTIPAGSNFTEVRVPFQSFSDLWSPATGEQNKTCAEDKSACPTAALLKEISRFEIWAEGKDGKVRVELQSISADASAFLPSVAAPSAGPQPPAQYNTCKDKKPVMGNLRFGMSGRNTTAGLPLPDADGESLAEAVCCDMRTAQIAEPQFLFQAPDINLFAKLDKGVTTFYDSVCGVPLFQTPVNRTLDDFKADTNEHGWPSFRTGEVFTDNVVTNMDTNIVTSSCGTHLGSYLPDEKGARWCMDLSCLAGNKL